jgi:predicted nicotinamide N-methyase
MDGSYCCYIHLVLSIEERLSHYYPPLRVAATDRRINRRHSAVVPPRNVHHCLPMTPVPYTLSLQVPPDAREGDNLTFTVDGVEMEIPVPPGTLPGQLLSVQLGDETSRGPSDEDPDISEDSVTIPLADGQTLVLATVLPSSPEILEMDESDGTHALAWPAGQWLADSLAHHVPRLPWNDKKDNLVLELGSGLGTAGMAFGHCFGQKIQRLVLTDHAAAVPLLQHNVRQNQALVPSHTVVHELEWSSAPTDRNTATISYDWILGSDILYNTESIPALVSTIEQLLGEHGGVLVAVRWRKPDIERGFFQTLRTGCRNLKWKLLDGASTTHWSEYGKASDIFFQQTMIGIGGKPKALGYITEQDTERMSQGEYDAWDRAQMQLYLGTSA